jgi:hypothetical protein
MMRTRCQTREFIRAAFFAVALVTAGHARADCTFSDLEDAIANIPSFLSSHTKCAGLLANPVFVAVSSGVTLAVMSSKDVKNACKEIEDLDTSVSGYQQKIKAFYHQLPSDAQNAINKIPGANEIGSSSADLTEVLSFLSCACALATESGPAQITEVAGSCLTTALCWLVTLGGSCDCPDPPPPVVVDCANAHKDAKKGIGVNYLPYGPTGSLKCEGDFCVVVDTSAGACWSGTIEQYCYCPKPMRLLYNDYLGYGCYCPENTHRAAGNSHDDPVLARICLCNSTNEIVKPDGTCPPPCNCGCPNNQVIAAKDSNTCKCTCGCPDGQVLAGGKCVKPCTGANQILLANGSCCLPTQVASCGTCCPFGTKPDVTTGSCVYAPMPPPVEKEMPQLPKTP